MVKIKRITDPPTKADGARILIERIWPRGIPEDVARITEWPQAIAPSEALRKWYSNKREKWDEFRKRYVIELNKEEARRIIASLRLRARKETVTLVHAAKDDDHNCAVVLRELLAMKID